MLVFKNQSFGSASAHLDACSFESTTAANQDYERSEVSLKPKPPPPGETLENFEEFLTLI